MVHGLAFSPDGRHLAAAGEDGRLFVWDTATRQLLLSLPSRSGLYDVAYLPDGKRLATAHQDGTTTRLGRGHRPATAHPGRPLEHGDQSSPPARTTSTSRPRATTALCGFGTPDPGRELVTVAAHAGPTYDIAYSPDGSRLATAGADGTGEALGPGVWPVGALLFPDMATGGLSGIAFSPDGRRVAAGGVDGAVFVGDSITGQTVLTLTGHTDMVWGLAFSPDGSRLATTSWDRTRQGVGPGYREGNRHVHRAPGIWSSASPSVPMASGSSPAATATGASGMRRPDRNCAPFSGEGLEVYGLALSPDGERLALGRQDGSRYRLGRRFGREATPAHRPRRPGATPGLQQGWHTPGHGQLRQIRQGVGYGDRPGDRHAVRQRRQRVRGGLQPGWPAIWRPPAATARPSLHPGRG